MKINSKTHGWLEISDHKAVTMPNDCPLWISKLKLFTHPTRFHNHLKPIPYTLPHSFTLTELSSGCGIVHGCKTRKEAIETGIKILILKGKVKTLEAIKKAIAQRAIINN